MRKTVLLLLALILLHGAAYAEAITAMEQLNGKPVGVQTGTSFDEIVLARLNDAKLEYFNSIPDMVAALEAGKISGFPIDEPVWGAIRAENPQIGRLEDFLDTFSFAYVFPKTEQGEVLCRQISEFIRELRTSGEIEKLGQKWLTGAHETAEMPDMKSLTGENGTLIFATEALNLPFTFVRSGKIVGYEIDLAIRFCQAYGYALQIQDMSFDAILPSVQSGKADFGGATISVTEERKESVFFSEPYYEGGTVMAVLSGAVPPAPIETETESSMDALNGRNIGIPTGTVYEDVTLARLPDVHLLYYYTYPDLVNALRTGRIAGFPCDEPVLETIIAENPQVTMLSEPLESFSYAYVFAKSEEGRKRCEQMSAFVEALKASGDLKALQMKWLTGAHEYADMPDMNKLSGENGTLRLATEALNQPFTFTRNNQVVGYEIELAFLFCQKNGYGLEILDMNFDALLPAIQTGKADFAGCIISITEERKESVLFSTPHYEGRTVMAVWKNGVGSEHVFSSLDELAGARIGVQTGTMFDEIALASVKDARLSYFHTIPDMVSALLSHKISGFTCDEPVLNAIQAENPKIGMLPEYLESFTYAFAFPKTTLGETLCQKMSDFVSRLKESGELDALKQKWLSGAYQTAEMPGPDTLTGENGTLILATEAMNLPFTFVRDGVIVGYEIELAIRFCEAYGYALQISDVSFDAILPSVQSDKADFGAATISVTEERKQSVAFSEPHYDGGTVMAVLREKTADMPEGMYASIRELDGRTVGVQTGSLFDQIVLSSIPNAALSYFDSVSDQIGALTTNKIEAFVVDEIVARQLMAENSALTYIPEYLDTYEQGVVFAKTEAGAALKAKFDTFLTDLSNDGKLSELSRKWLDLDETARTMPDPDSLSGENGVLRLATESGYVPMCYIRDGKAVGLEMELIVRFCQDAGYRLEIVDMNFNGILPAVQSGKCDMGMSGIAINEERAESVLFSVPDYYGGTVAVVLKAGQEAAEPSFWMNMLESMERTFIRENRWQMFLQGTGNTLFITVLSVLFGTALGFAVFMACRNGNPFALLITRFCTYLVQGMPMVVLLMILYYVIFGSTPISGILVAVIGFTLTFGSSVYSMLRMGVGAVDNGQYEAAYALGYPNRRTFFRIILPQALPHVLPAYKGEIVGLIKSTAIVGYIAVQDLTKMGDIVRSRTYEAFFPLIAVTVIYFLLEGLLAFLVSRITVNINPRRRRPETILKGVKLHDQD